MRHDDLYYERYRSLIAVLDEALKRATEGKGAERHVRGDEPFERHWILEGARSFGLGGLQFQIGKKNLEICNLKDTQDKINELLDIVVYASAAVILLREGG